MTHHVVPEFVFNAPCFSLFSSVFPSSAQRIENMISGDCDYCGSQGFILCTECGGDKKSVHLQYGESARKGLSHQLKCTACNENGLMVCRACMTSTMA